MPIVFGIPLQLPRMLRVTRMLRLNSILSLLAVVPLFAQVSPDGDAAGCVDSKVVPKLLGCRIDHCEKMATDRRDVAIGEDNQGDVRTASIEGESRSVMYECREGTTPGDIVQQGAAALKAASFEVPYLFSEKEGAISAKKGDFWVLLDAASHYYTLVELKATLPDETVSDAAEMAEAIERKGHVAIYGLGFGIGSADIAPESVPLMREIAALLDDNPEWRIRVEGHTDRAGTKLGNIALSQKRSAAVVAWLAGRGIKRARLESSGLGDTKPVTTNDTEEGRAKNRRIELVRIDPASP